MIRSPYAPAIKTSLSVTEQNALQQVMDAPAPAPQPANEIAANLAAYRAMAAKRGRR